MLGAIIILVLFYVGLFQLVRFYDNAYKYESYWKWRYRINRLIKRKNSKRSANNQILGFQNQ